ncbi:MAG: EamA family transporter [Candidatus Delongbacteria bacterium]|nr:EamA family transporter [Candidatus Delongbacteria bacterium]MBN2834911.1 EamA family transporter [Candidatus Delongbacteria bacterium]
MIYLFLAILMSAMVSLVLKYSETRQLKRYVVTSINYIVASIASLIMLINQKESISYLFYKESVNGEISGTFIFTIVLGVVSGLLYFLGFILIQQSIKKNGVSITGAFSKLGIFIPVLFSIIFWNEVPDLLKLFGILLSFISVFVINYNKENKVSSLKNFNILLILVLLVVGTGDFTNKIFEKYANLEYKNLYLFILFFTALLISAYYSLKDFLKERYRLTFVTILTGIFVGLPNLFTSYFLIESFKDLNTGIAYSIFSSGTILLITTGGIVLFKEKPKKNEIIALGIIILALVTLSL